MIKKLEEENKQKEELYDEYIQVNEQALAEKELNIKN